MKRKTLRRKRRQRKTRKGGKNIGEGGFGRVYAPGMLCNGTAAEVTKVLTVSRREQAKNIIAKLKSISERLKPYDKYFIIPEFCEGTSTLSQTNIDDGLTEADKEISYNMKLGEMTLAQKYESDMKKALNVAKNPSPPGKLSVKATFMPVFKKVKELIDKLHSLNILHGDLSPSNVMVMKDDGSYRLIDFDLSREGELLPSEKRREIVGFIEDCLPGWSDFLPGDLKVIVDEVLKT